MIDEPNQFLSLLNKNFQSREELLSTVREIGLMQGYVMVIKRSKANKYVIIGCDRGDNYRGSRIPAEKRQKKSALTVFVGKELFGNNIDRKKEKRNTDFDRLASTL